MRIVKKIGIHCLCGDASSVNPVCVLQLYDEADMQEEKVRISRAMGSVQDSELIQRVLDFSLSVSCCPVFLSANMSRAGYSSY